MVVPYFNIETSYAIAASVVKRSTIDRQDRLCVMDRFQERPFSRFRYRSWPRQCLRDSLARETSRCVLKLIEESFRFLYRCGIKTLVYLPSSLVFVAYSFTTSRVQRMQKLTVDGPSKIFHGVENKENSNFRQQRKFQFSRSSLRHTCRSTNKVRLVKSVKNVDSR